MHFQEELTVFILILLGLFRNVYYTSCIQFKNSKV